MNHPLRNSTSVIKNSWAQKYNTYVTALYTTKSYSFQKDKQYIIIQNIKDVNVTPYKKAEFFKILCIAEFSLF